MLKFQLLMNGKLQGISKFCQIGRADPLIASIALANSRLG
jgi:hypothetical protein